LYSLTVPNSLNGTSLAGASTFTSSALTTSPAIRPLTCTKVPSWMSAAVPSLISAELASTGVPRTLNVIVSPFLRKSVTWPISTTRRCSEAGTSQTRVAFRTGPPVSLPSVPSTRTSFMSCTSVHCGPCPPFSSAVVASTRMPLTENFLPRSLTPVTSPPMCKVRPSSVGLRATRTTLAVSVPFAGSASL